MWGWRGRPRGAGAVLGVVAVLAVALAASSAYTVRRGDTVDGIAARFGVTPAGLVAANQLANPNFIMVGQQLEIPGQAGSGGSTGPAQNRSSSGGFHWPAKPTPPLVPIPTATPGTPRFPAELLAYPARLALRPQFQRWARAEGISAGLLEAVAWVESGWQAHALSSAGAVGVAQIEPGTAAFISHDLLGLRGTLDARRPSDSIEMEATYLAWLLRQTHGNVANALGGYYQGLTALRIHGPLDSTRWYVSLVGRLWNQFHSG